MSNAKQATHDKITAPRRNIRLTDTQAAAVAEALDARIEHIQTEPKSPYFRRLLRDLRAVRAALPDTLDGEVLS